MNDLVVAWQAGVKTQGVEDQGGGVAVGVGRADRHGAPEHVQQAPDREHPERRVRETDPCVERQDE